MSERVAQYIYIRLGGGGGGRAIPQHGTHSSRSTTLFRRSDIPGMQRRRNGRAPLANEKHLQTKPTTMSLGTLKTSHSRVEGSGALLVTVGALQ